MSFDHQLYKSTLCDHLCNRLGWPMEESDRIARIACDVLRLTHGGDRHYIPSRHVDTKSVLGDHQEGKSIAQLAQLYGITARAVRDIIR